MSACFSFYPILLHYSFNQGVAWLMPQATWMLFRKHDSWGPLQKGSCWAAVLSLLEKLIQCNRNPLESHLGNLIFFLSKTETKSLSWELLLLLKRHSIKGLEIV